MVAVMGDLTSEGHVIGNPESRQGARVAQRAFPQAANEQVSDIVVIRSERFRVSDLQFKALVRSTETSIRGTGVANNITSYLDPRAPAPLVSRDRHASAIALYVDGADAIPPVESVVHRADRDPSFAANITGSNTLDNDFDTLAGDDLRNGELRVGAPAALIVLCSVFGAVVAGLVPLLMASVSIIVALGLLGAAFEPVLALHFRDQHAHRHGTRARRRLLAVRDVSLSRGARNGRGPLDAIPPPAQPQARRPVQRHGDGGPMFGLFIIPETSCEAWRWASWSA